MDVDLEGDAWRSGLGKTWWMWHSRVTGRLEQHRFSFTMTLSCGPITGGLEGGLPEHIKEIQPFYRCFVRHDAWPVMSRAKTAEWPEAHAL